jgi:hypothetical protein
VIRISFGGGVIVSRHDLEDSLDGQLAAYEAEFGGLAEFLLRRRFPNLIRVMHSRNGKPGCRNWAVPMWGDENP